MMVATEKALLSMFSLVIMSLNSDPKETSAKT